MCSEKVMSMIRECIQRECNANRDSLLFLRESLHSKHGSKRLINDERIEFLEDNQHICRNCGSKEENIEVGIPQY